MPDYANAILITIQSMTGWTAPEDGYIYMELQSEGNTTARIFIDEKPIAFVDGEGANYGYCFAPMRKGSKITFSGVAHWVSRRFYPLI